MTNTKTEKGIAATGSLAIHVLIALLLMLTLKDCGSGGGAGDGYMALNIASLGDYDQGSGESNDAASQAAASPQPTPVEEQSVETQEESVVSAPKNDKPVVKPNQTKPTENKPVEKPAEKPNSTTTSAIGALGGEGKESGKGETEGGGKEGNPNGQVDGKGIFGGSGGSGEWNLTGRTMPSPPRLDEKPKNEATIKVSIQVDRNGNVTSASIADYTGSTVGRADLEALAIKAAKSAKFSANPNGPPSQRGTITISFKLK